MRRGVHAALSRLQSQVRVPSVRFYPLVHCVPSSVLLALIVTALLVVWTHGQSSREARRKPVYVVVALLLTLAIAFFSRTKSFFRTLGLSQTADEYVLLTVVFAFTALIFFVLGQFGVHLWGRLRGTRWG